MHVPTRCFSQAKAGLGDPFWEWPATRPIPERWRGQGEGRPEFRTVDLGTLHTVFYGKVFPITKTTTKQGFPPKGALC